MFAPITRLLCEIQLPVDGSTVHGGRVLHLVSGIAVNQHWLVFQHGG